MRILHLFNWKLLDIIKVLPEIKAQGFSCIQINPIQPLKSEEDIWWLSYQPTGFKIGNKFGSKEDLTLLCSAAKKLELKIISDVVLNHSASVDSGEILPHEMVDEELRENPWFWKNHELIKDWNNRKEVITNSLGLPSFRLDNYELQDIIIKFLNELIDCGVRGFRFDASKNISLPEEDGNHFWIRVLNNLNHKEELVNYAEVIYTGQKIIDSYCQYVNVLTESHGSYPDKLVKFVDSHDLEKEFKFTEGKSDNDIIKEYCDLVEKYPNTIFYARAFNDSWKDIRVKNANKS